MNYIPNLKISSRAVKTATIPPSALNRLTINFRGLGRSCSLETHKGKKFPHMMNTCNLLTFDGGTENRPCEPYKWHIISFQMFLIQKFHKPTEPIRHIKKWRSFSWFKLQAKNEKIIAFYFILLMFIKHHVNQSSPASPVPSWRSKHKEMRWITSSDLVSLRILKYQTSIFRAIYQLIT